MALSVIYRLARYSGSGDLARRLTPERPLHLIHVMADGIGLTLQETVDRFAEFGVFQPVPGMRGGGDQPARQFVFALRAAFERLQTLGDGVFDALLVAGFEVQAGHIFQRAPVAAV